MTGWRAGIHRDALRGLGAVEVPRTEGVSTLVTIWLSLLKPRPLIISLCLGGVPIALLTYWIRKLAPCLSLSIIFSAISL